MPERFTITILTDSTSWMNKYSQLLAAELERVNHKVRLINTKTELQNGDVAFFLSCFEMIEPEYLRLHKNNIVVHESKLPSGKGWSPMTWQIIEGKTKGQD